jgi:hypothetical protein
MRANDAPGPVATPEAAASLPADHVLPHNHGRSRRGRPGAVKMAHLTAESAVLTHIRGSEPPPRQPHLITIFKVS